MALADEDFEGRGKELVKSKPWKLSKQQEPCLKIWDRDIGLISARINTSIDILGANGIV